MIPRSKQFFSLSSLSLSASAVACVCAAGANAQMTNERPRELEGVDIVEHLDEQLPLDLEFIDAEGKTVRLGDYFTGERPVIITLNYFECPMLCSLQLNGLLGRRAVARDANRGIMGDAGSGLMALEWNLGEEFEIVTVSFDPDETTDLAAGKQQTYLKAYRRDGVTSGWHFLTGTAKNSRALADAIGFGYRYNEENGEWAHAAAIFIATPDGRLARYLYGVDYPADTLRMALLEASEGKIGSTLDRFILWCFHYDDTTGQYTVAVMNIMRLVGLATMAGLGAGLFILWRRDAKRTSRSSIDAVQASIFNRQSSIHAGHSST